MKFRRRGREITRTKGYYHSKDPDIYLDVPEVENLLVFIKDVKDAIIGFFTHRD